MKKILRNIFISILIIILAGAGGIWYYLFGMGEKPNEDAKQYIVDNQGTTYLAVTDDDGVTYAVVTDEDGNRNAHKFENGVVGDIVGNVNNDVKPEELPTNYTGPHIDVTANSNDYAGDVITEVPTVGTTKPSQGSQENNNPTKPSQSAGDKNDPYRLEAYRIQKYHDIIAGGTFLMETTMEDPEMGETPVIMAIKNGNTYVETSMKMESMNISCKVLYQKNTDSTYLIIDGLNKYTKVPAEMLGEGGSLDMASALQDNYASEDVKDVKVSKVKINGKDLILESYNSDNGSTVNYYFDGENLVRRDDIYSDGSVDSTIFSRFTTDVPDSYFKIPDGYGYFNISWLESFM